MPIGPIASPAGEVPAAPPRPQGVERNVVVTVWNWSDDKGFVHDTISTDKRNPTLNANGLIYSISRFSAPEMNVLDPVRHTATGVTVPIRDANTPTANPQKIVQPSPYWGDEIIWSSRASLHNPMMDATGRVWLTHAIRHPDTQPRSAKRGRAIRRPRRSRWTPRLAISRCSTRRRRSSR